MTARPRPSVAVVYHFYPHYRRAIVEALARSERADFTFFGDDHEYLHSIEPAVLSDHVRFVRTPTYHMGGPFMWQWGAIRIAFNPAYDTIVFHPVPHWPCTWIGAFLARLFGKQVMFWGHGFLAPPRGVNGLIRRALHALAGVQMFYGRRAKQFAMDLGWSPAKLHVIYNSQDLREQIAARERVTGAVRSQVRVDLFGEDRTPVLVCSTRLVAVRRLDLLIEAAAELKRRSTAVNIILIGDGPVRGDLEALASARGIRVHFEGACYDEQRIAELIMSSNVTVSPGRVGLTVTHSMVYGVPVISHGDGDDQGPEWEAIIPGRTGAYFTKGDVGSLADAIMPWLRTSFPSDAVRDACHAIVDRFWNSSYQQHAIERAVCGEDADDLWDVRKDFPIVVHEPRQCNRCSS
ncbi:MAG: glycosyltransferase [Phycisphaerales bacterium]|nr:glycosyltransferase [Phycisphaerales bacterium]